VLTDQVTLSIGALPARVQTRELCSIGPEAVRSAVIVRHARGGSIQLSACEHCASAVRRIVAAAGAITAIGPATIAVVTDVQPVAATSPAEVLPDAVGPPVLVHEFSEGFISPAGIRYTVRVGGQERSDGTWIGWLTFVGPTIETTRRTGRETTQSNYDHLAYWATGLQPTYLEGAFSRSS
jgi:hypothetical protein